MKTLETHGTFEDVIIGAAPLVVGLARGARQLAVLERQTALGIGKKSGEPA